MAKKPLDRYIQSDCFRKLEFLDSLIRCSHMNHLSTSSVFAKTKAVVCRPDGLKVEDVALSPVGDDELVVEVRALGICRTDLYAIAGEIRTKPGPLIPGHEFAGVVAAVGAAVDRYHVGDRVVIDPVVGCGVCSDCESSLSHLCTQITFMGVDFDGGCRQRVVVPESMVYSVPPAVPLDVVAFAEPVAATLGIFNSGIRPHEKGLLLGSGRITTLAERVLRAKKFGDVTVASLDEAQALPDNAFDFVIETDATTEMFLEMVRLVRGRGRVVLKSRQHLPFEVTLRNIVAKQPIIEVVHYGPFREAVELLITEQVTVDDLIGQRFELDEFATAFQVAAQDEDRKTFLIPGGLG